LKKVLLVGKNFMGPKFATWFFGGKERSPTFKIKITMNA
jgi:hypothetical protein